MLSGRSHMDSAVAVERMDREHDLSVQSRIQSIGFDGSPQG